MGGQVHRAVRRGLHPAEAGFQPRAHHHSQVAAARRPRPAGRAAGGRAAAPGGAAAAQDLALPSHTAGSQFFYKRWTNHRHLKFHMPCLRRRCSKEDISPVYVSSTAISTSKMGRERNYSKT